MGMGGASFLPPVRARGMVLVLLLLWAAVAETDSAWVLEAVGEGEINWSSGVILARGRGEPPAEAGNISRARLMAEWSALAEARAKLGEVLKAVRVDGTTRMEDLLRQLEPLRKEVERLVQGAAELSDRRHYGPAGIIEVTVALPLQGELFARVLNERAGPAVLSPTSDREGALSLPAEAGVSSKPNHSQFTGLVVDGRHLSLFPALIPRILDERGVELYPAEALSPGQASGMGLALYFRDLEAAQANSRVGKNPLTVKAWKMGGPAEIILGGEDAQRLALLNRGGSLDGRVLIVLGGP